MATLQQSFNSLRLTGTVVLTVLCAGQLALFAASTLAQTPKRASSVLTYVPPNRGTPTRGIRGAGSRGCSLPQASGGLNATKLVQMTLLVPGDHIGQTVSSHPSFYWHVSTVPSVPMEFSLVQPGVAQPLLVKQVMITKPGVVELTLPANQPGLEVGKRYRWSVALVCNADRRSNDIFAQSWIERVASDRAPAQVTSMSPTQRAEAYAQAGLWFDALKTSVVADANTLPLVTLNREFQALLEQGGLPGVVAQIQ